MASSSSSSDSKDNKEPPKVLVSYLINDTKQTVVNGVSIPCTMLDSTALIPLKAPIPQTTTKTILIVNSTPNTKIVIGPEVAKWILQFFSRPMEHQEQVDCIEFAQQLLLHHPTKHVIANTSEMKRNVAMALLMKGAEPCSTVVEWLEERTINENRHVRVCHAALYIGGDTFFSKLGLSPSYPLLSYDQISAMYLKATSIRFAVLSDVCFGCKAQNKNVKRCTKCWQAQYCNVTCQRMHFAEHKHYCKPLLTTLDRILSFEL